MRRPWHVYGRWSMAEEEQAHRSYATPERAMFRAIVWQRSGMFDIRVWQVDDAGNLLAPGVYRLDSALRELSEVTP